MSTVTEQLTVADNRKVKRWPPLVTDESKAVCASWRLLGKDSEDALLAGHLLEVRKYLEKALPNRPLHTWSLRSLEFFGFNFGLWQQIRWEFEYFDKEAEETRRWRVTQRLYTESGKTMSITSHELDEKYWGPPAYLSGHVNCRCTLNPMQSR